MNGKRAKKLRRLARQLAEQPGQRMAQVHDNGTATAVYFPLSPRGLYQKMKKVVRRHGRV